jgi:hypothetical protein
MTMPMDELNVIRKLDKSVGLVVRQYIMMVGCEDMVS